MQPADPELLVGPQVLSKRGIFSPGLATQPCNPGGPPCFISAGPAPDNQLDTRASRALPVGGRLAEQPAGQNYTVALSPSSSVAEQDEKDKNKMVL